jgi:hypothetical protein
LKTQLNNIRFAFLCLIITSLVGCKLADQLSKKKVNDNLMIRYALYYDNRTSNHKPYEFIVSIDTLNVNIRYHVLYQFHLKSNAIEKLQINGKERKDYVLITDSVNMYPKEELFLITPFESQIFERIIYLSDSLKLKDFNFLKQAKGFKIISQKS